MATIKLKQSTAGQQVIIGPFIDDTDFKTEETGLSIANTDIDLFKNGAAAVTKNSGGATHRTNGMYAITLDATDTNTVGELEVYVKMSGALPVKKPIQIVEESVYDALYATSAAGFDANGRVDLGSILGTAVATPATAGYLPVTLKSGTGTGEVSLSSGGVTLSATSVDAIWDEPVTGHNAANSFGSIFTPMHAGTMQSGSSSSTAVLASGASSSNDYYNNQLLAIVAGTGAGQSAYISDYVGSTRTATMGDTWTTTPDATSVYHIVAGGSIPGASAPSAATVAAAVWNATSASHTSEGSFGAQFQTIHEGTAQGGTTSSITLDATGSSSTNDLYKYQRVVIIAGTGAGQSRIISGYTGSSKVASIAPDWTTSPSTDSQYRIDDLGIDAATVAQIADAVWDEARADHQSAGTYGEYTFSDAIRISGAAAAADGVEAAVSGATPLPVNVTQVGGASQNLPTSSALATVDANVDAILVDTGTSIPALIAALNDIAASDVLAATLTESYAATGAEPTLQQAILLIQQYLLDKSVSGTTLTVKELDGSTTAVTATLNSGSSPTSIDRD